MKKIAFLFALFISITANAQIDAIENGKNGFDFDLFQKTLTEEMIVHFDWMKEDTSINFAARATSQKEANYIPCFVTRKVGMVNLDENEVDQAKRLVSQYKEELLNDRYLGGEEALRKYYVEFAAVATKQYGGLIRYGLIVDNNFVRESICNNVIYPDED
jgi:hypothetical protein